MESAQRTTGKNKFFHSVGFRLGASIGSVILAFAIAIVISAFAVFNSYSISYARTQVEAMADTVADNYDNYFSSVISVSNRVASLTYNVDDVAASKASLTDQFDSILAVKTDITSIALYSEDGATLFVNDSTSLPQKNGVSKELWFQKAMANPTLNVFTPSIENSFIMSKVLAYDKGVGSTVLFVKVSSVASSIYQVDLGYNGGILIYDKDYVAVYSSDTNLTAEQIPLLKAGVIGYREVSYATHTYVLSQYTISNTQWRLAIFQNFDAVKATMNRFIWTIMILVAALVVVTILILIVVTRSITRPLYALRSSMQKVEEQGYTSYEPVPISGSTETRDLGRNYNEMMLRIKTLNEDVLAEQNAQRLSELHALQNQINPHFLYNTLDSIVFMIDDGKNKEASEMVVALSRFFRISISKGRNIIPLKDEVEHVRNYLLIQKLRYKEAFEYTFDVPEDLNDLLVLKLILQPIVENAIQHGLLNKDGVGKISIAAHMEGEILVLSVTDNGYGIMPEKIDEIYESFKDKNVYNGVGLKNVYQRLKIYFGEKADVKVTSVLDEGTTVTLIIPVKERKINEE